MDSSYIEKGKNGIFFTCYNCEKISLFSFEEIKEKLRKTDREYLEEMWKENERKDNHVDRAEALDDIIQKWRKENFGS